MADKSITQLTKVTLLAPTDVFVVVAGENTSKIELSDLASNVKSIIGPVTSDTPVSGVIGVSKSLTSLNGSLTSLTLPNATTGFTKLITVDGYSSPITIGVANGNGFTQIVLSAVGQTVQLIYTTKWNVISSYGAVIS